MKSDDAHHARRGYLSKQNKIHRRSPQSAAAVTLARGKSAYGYIVIDKPRYFVLCFSPWGAQQKKKPRIRAYREICRVIHFRYNPHAYTIPIILCGFMVCADTESDWNRNAISQTRVSFDIHHAQLLSSTPGRRDICVIYFLSLRQMPIVSVKTSHKYISKRSLRQAACVRSRCTIARCGI